MLSGAKLTLIIWTKETLRCKQAALLSTREKEYNSAMGKMACILIRL
jgi:hypothetical protein